MCVWLIVCVLILCLFECVWWDFWKIIIICCCFCLLFDVVVWWVDGVFVCVNCNFWCLWCCGWCDWCMFWCCVWWILLICMIVCLMCGWFWVLMICCVSEWCVWWCGWCVIWGVWINWCCCCCCWCCLLLLLWSVGVLRRIIRLRYFYFGDALIYFILFLCKLVCCCVNFLICVVCCLCICFWIIYCWLGEWELKICFWTLTKSSWIEILSSRETIFWWWCWF